jgi:peroxiredoxin 2/4
MAVQIGSPAPDFNVKAVQDREIIENFTFSQFRGRYVVLFF